MAIRFGDAVTSFLNARKSRMSEDKESVEAEKARMELENMKKWSGMYDSPDTSATAQSFNVDTGEPDTGGPQITGLPSGPRFGPKSPSFGPSQQGFGTDQPYVMIPDPTTGRVKMVQNPDRMTPYQNKMAGLADLRAEELQRKTIEERQAQSNKEEMLTESARSMLGTIGEVKKGKKYFGPLGGLPTIAAPSTIASFGKDYGPRMNWETNVQKLLSEKVVNLMNEMKQASRTGATGFGQLNRSELQLLQNASTALRRELMPEDAMRYLGEIEKLYQKVLIGKQQFGADQKQPTDDFSQMSDDELRRMAGVQ